MRFSLLIFAFTLVLCPQLLAQTTLVKFYPFGETKLCKGCGHLHDDLWNLGIRLENISGSDLKVYGTQYEGSDDFSFLDYFQYLDPNMCEWRYGTGEPTRRIAWKDRQDYEKRFVILKPGQSLERSIGMSRFDTEPSRMTAFVALPNTVEPTEVFSMPFVMNHEADGDSMSFQQWGGGCTVKCVSGTSGPTVRGIYLGMSLDDFKKRFPFEEIHKLREGQFDRKTAYVFDWHWDAWDISVRFLDDRVASIEPRFHSLDKARERADFWELVASKIGLTPFWQPFRSRWECKDFIVEVITNEDPTIMIQTKEYLKMQDRLNEEYIKKLK